MSDPEVKALKAEIAKLREDIAELRQSSFAHFESFTTHICEQHKEIGDLYSYVMPIIRKMYPDFVATKKQFDAVLARKDHAFPLDDAKKKPDENA